MKPDQERVKNLLTDTVTLLCKNGLTFSKELRVEGLLGITTDSNDVFFVHISDAFGENGEPIKEQEERDLREERANADKRGLKARGDDSPPRRNVHQSHSHSSSYNRPSSPKSSSSRHSSSSSTPTPTVKIKQEKQDDVILIEAKHEVSQSSCSRQQHGNYMDSAHGNGSFSGLELSMDSAQGSYDQYDSIDGEPPRKRRMGSEGGDDSESGGGDSFGAYITGIVKNVHDKPDMSQGNDWTPPAVNLGAEIAAQMAQAAMAQGDNSLAGLENLPGCSSWQPGTPSSQPSDMTWSRMSISCSGGMNRGWTPAMPLPQKAREKEWRCTYPDCSKTFAHQSSLRNHVRDLHMRGEAQRHSCPVPGCNATFVHRTNLYGHKKTFHRLGRKPPTGSAENTIGYNV